MAFISVVKKNKNLNLNWSSRDRSIATAYMGVHLSHDT